MMIAMLTFNITYYLLFMSHKIKNVSHKRNVNFLISNVIYCIAIAFEMFSLPMPMSMSDKRQQMMLIKIKTVHC